MSAREFCSHCKIPDLFSTFLNPINTLFTPSKFCIINVVDVSANNWGYARCIVGFEKVANGHV